MNAADLIASFETGVYTVTRRAAATFDAKGAAVPGSTSAGSIHASVQPATGRDLLRLPEGRRAIETRVLYTTTRLLVGAQHGSVDGSNEADLVAIDGAVWEVQHVEAWQAVDGHWKVIVQLSGVASGSPVDATLPPPGTLHRLVVTVGAAPMPVFQRPGGGIAPIDWSQPDRGASQIDALIGLLMAPAAAGSDVAVVVPFQLVPGFGTWPVSTSLWVLDTGVGLYSSVPVGNWTRLLGVVQDGGVLLFQRGEPVLKE